MLTSALHARSAQPRACGDVPGGPPRPPGVAPPGQGGICGLAAGESARLRPLPTNDAQDPVLMSSRSSHRQSHCPDIRLRALKLDTSAGRGRSGPPREYRIFMQARGESQESFLCRGRFEPAAPREIQPCCARGVEHGTQARSLSWKSDDMPTIDRPPGRVRARARGMFNCSLQMRPCAPAPGVFRKAIFGGGPCHRSRRTGATRGHGSLLRRCGSFLSSRHHGRAARLDGRGSRTP
jgi:hypothetical protein